MWPCGGSSTRQYWDTAPTRRPCVKRDRAPVSSNCGSFRQPALWPATNLAWAAGPEVRFQFARVGAGSPWAVMSLHGRMDVTEIPELLTRAAERSSMLVFGVAFDPAF